MPHGFDMYRVFISAPGDLGRERQACHDAIATVNETTAMPAKVLLVSVGLREDEQITGSRSIVSDNVRWSTFFIQVFEDDWGPKNLFRKLFYLAIECRDDASMPMREVVVCLKDAPHETDPEILAFRQELQDRKDIRLFRYASLDALKAQLLEVSTGWAQAIVQAKTAASGAAG
jgi:hypothetical protein